MKSSMKEIMMKLGKLFGIALGLLLATGCGASLQFSGWVPGHVSVGNSDRLVITDAEGRRSAREYTTIDLGKQAGNTGYFQTSDRSEKVKMEITGREVAIIGDEEGIGATDLYVRMDVLDWEADKDTKEESYKDKEGNSKTRTIKIITGNALIQVTLSDENNRAILAEKEYEGTSEFSGDTDKTTAIESAASNAIAMLLGDITPKSVRYTVKLDGSDKGIKDYIKGARKGAVKQSLDDIAAYVANNPNSAAAQYALAVMYDATGDYETALTEYDKAIALGGKPWYGDTRSSCATRKTAAAELSKSE
jgi:tetratricopeptide (TPR) repeat protein